MSFVFAIVISAYSCKDDEGDTDDNVTRLRITVVKQSDQTPCEGVLVNAEHDGGGYDADRLTDADGKVVYENIPAGVYSVSSTDSDAGLYDYSEFTVFEGQTTEEVILID